MTLAIAALLLGLTDTAAAWSPGGRSQAEDLTISLATFGPGAELPELWGHSALVVIDKRLELGRLYNYGAFDFTPDFAVKFLAGRLEFHVEEAGIMWIYGQYKEVDRSISVQELDFTPEQALRAANALAVNVLPENASYLYHHFEDNCSTRPRDILDAALGGALSRATAAPARMSLRDHMRRYSQVYPPVALWLDFLHNDRLDRPVTVREEAFIPDELERQLDALVIDGRPVVKLKSKPYTSKTIGPPAAETPRWAGALALFSLLAGAAVLALSRLDRPAARRTLGALLALEGLVWGLCGLFGFIIGTFTDNLVTHHNVNLFFLNPLTLALLPLGVMLMFDKQRAPAGLKWVTSALLGLALLGLAAKLLPVFAQQQNANIVAMVLPLTALSALAFALPRPPRAEA